MAEGTGGSRSRSGNSVKKGRVIEFEKEKETKGAVRYAEVPEEGKDPFVRTIYLRKELYTELGSPDALEVTLKPLAD